MACPEKERVVGYPEAIHFGRNLGTACKEVAHRGSWVMVSSETVPMDNLDPRTAPRSDVR